MKSESQVVVDVGSISQSPRRLRAKYTLCTNQKIYDKWYFALPGATAEKISSVQMLTHLELVRTRTVSS